MCSWKTGNGLHIPKNHSICAQQQKQHFSVLEQCDWITHKDQTVKLSYHWESRLLNMQYRSENSKKYPCG